MIAFIKGTLAELSPLLAVVELHGMGYAVHIPVTTAERLPSIGQEVKLYTLVIFREESQTIYGFHGREERDFFQLLVEKVSGIGPKIALTIMSKLSVALLKNAIAQSDVSLLSKCPGIGKKTAERLIIELRDKIFPVAAKEGINEVPFHSGAFSSPHQDAVAALMTLGYKAAEADKAVRFALTKKGTEATVEVLIKEALGR